MSEFKLLLVEDNEQDCQLCRACVADFQKENDCTINLIECRSVEDAFSKLDGSFDGAIIDLKLGNNGNEGNQIINRIEELYFRIPVAILTGTPDATDPNFDYIGIFKKGDRGAGYADLLKSFWGIHNTGLTRIMGGRGVIEETLNKVFRQNLLPRRAKWVTYGESNPSRTEKALLRHALSHLLQLLDNDEDRCFPEEFYLAPPLTNKLQTGSIIKEKRSDRFFVVLNPSCDLVVRQNGDFKTDHILCVEVQKELDVVNPELDQISSGEKKKKKHIEILSNNFTSYYHWLPKTDFFNGGFLNFRKLSTMSKAEFDERFDTPTIQISSSFVTDVVARFSSYYARQGQPDIEFGGFIGT